MTAASAALAAVLLGAVFLTPVARLNYHAWRWRTGRRAKSLKCAAELIAERRLAREAVLRLLGEPREQTARGLEYDAGHGLVEHRTGPKTAIVPRVFFTIALDGRGRAAEVSMSFGE